MLIEHSHLGEIELLLSHLCINLDVCFSQDRDCWLKVKSWLLRDHKIVVNLDKALCVCVIYSVYRLGPNVLSAKRCKRLFNIIGLPRKRLKMLFNNRTQCRSKRIKPSSLNHKYVYYYQQNLDHKHPCNIKVFIHFQPVLPIHIHYLLLPILHLPLTQHIYQLRECKPDLF